MGLRTPPQRRTPALHALLLSLLALRWAWPSAVCQRPAPRVAECSVARRALGVPRTLGPLILDDDPLSEHDGEEPTLQEKELYFNQYGYLAEQMAMLEDTERTGAYQRAILGNRHCFEGKVVLDIGCGTGVLAMFAAQAGARRVYAVEASRMASAAKVLVEANGLGDIVHVIRGMTETVSVPEKVDVIVSEWMGNLLLKEAMLETVLQARDRFLKPGGALFPSHATLYLVPCSNTCFGERWQKYVDENWRWQSFVDSMNSRYNFNFTELSERHVAETSESTLQTWDWADMNTSCLHGPATPLLDLDLSAVSLERARSLQYELLNCSLHIDTDGVVGGLCGFFAVEFRGSEHNPAREVVRLSTGPEANSTHWGQQLFGFYPQATREDLGVAVEAGDLIHCGVRIKYPEDNRRVLRLEASLQHTTSGGYQLASWQEGWFV